MNTYNENLHASVVTSLQAQELELQNMQASLDSSIVTLYYSEGARITAQQQLDLASGQYKSAQDIRVQAVRNNNIAVNLNACANEQKTHTALSVSNISVAAANTQVAANAILRLTGDVGNILNMAQAADFDNEIYLQSVDANTVMSDTAYLAEAASQVAMKASYLTAEVAAATVAAEAKATATAVAALLTVTTADFDAMTETVAAKDNDVAAASDTEKVAEGVVEFVNADYYAGRKAYTLNNKELNLNLWIPYKGRTSTAYTVHFNRYVAPFGLKESVASAGTKEDTASYPVKDYYIMLVKESKQPIFSMADAEALLLTPARYVKIEGRKAQDVNIVNISRDRDGENYLLDSDGEPMELGNVYVVFLLAVFDDVYKKTLNNFDDYLTAASEKFSLTRQLASPAAKNIKAFPEEESDQVLFFVLEEEAGYQVEYRCIFLADYTADHMGMLTANGLRKVQEEVERMSETEESRLSEIKKLSGRLNSMTNELKTLEHDMSIAAEKRDKARNPKDRKKFEDEVNALKLEIDQLIANMEKIRAELANLPHTNLEQPGFFFNLNLAEQVPLANYYPAKMIESDSADKTLKLPKGWPDAILVKQSDNGKAVRLGSLKIGKDFTDNYGNKLVSNKPYIPVVLSYSTDEKWQQYHNSLSAYTFTHYFIYHS